MGRASLVVAAGLARKNKGSNAERMGGSKTNRYRIGWDADLKEALPDSGVGRLTAGASTWAGANWRFGNASVLIPMPDYSASPILP